MRHNAYIAYLLFLVCNVSMLYRSAALAPSPRWGRRSGPWWWWPWSYWPGPTPPWPLVNSCKYINPKRILRFDEKCKNLCHLYPHLYLYPHSTPLSSVVCKYLSLPHSQFESSTKWLTTTYQLNNVKARDPVRSNTLVVSTSHNNAV